MARERYLIGDQEEAINKPGAEITADTKKAKWDNFWFYHKWHIVMIAAACLLVVWFVHDLASKVNPDYQIGLITQQSYPDDMVQGLGNEIAKYGKDLNGDGKVIVQINSYAIPPDRTNSQGSASSAVAINMQQDEATQVKFMADLTDATSVIFLTDDASFKKQQKVNSLFAYLDGTTPQKDAADYDKMRVSWDQCKVLSKFKISASQLSQGDVQKLLSKFSISMRVPASNKTGNAYYTQSKALLNKLVYDK